MTSSNRRRARHDPSLRARITSVRALTRDGVTVRAGSSLVRHGGRLLAIQDDAWEGVWIDPHDLRLEPVALARDARALPKAVKPDFEAAFTAPDGIWVAGSGATSKRCSLVRFDPASRHAEVVDAQPLYAAIREALRGVPNVEGAQWCGDRVRLLNRGAAAVPNAIVDVAFADFRRGVGPVRTVEYWDLGAIAGTALTFTDAAAAGGALVYLAAAEDTPDAVADGPVVGAALGIVDGDAARWNHLVEADGAPSRRKVEGLALDDDGRSGWLLTDPDDARRPAELCRLVLEEGV